MSSVKVSKKLRQLIVCQITEGAGKKHDALNQYQDIHVLQRYNSATYSNKLTDKNSGLNCLFKTDSFLAFTITESLN
jgi:hypothetical protein